VRRRTHFNLLVVRGDGVRVLRVGFPRRLVVLGVAALLIATAIVGALAADWWALRRFTHESRPYAALLAAERAKLADISPRLGEMRREVAAWREIHARLFDAFGPEATKGARDKGIGGPAAPIDRVPDHLSPQEELSRLADGIAEESQNLKALDTLMARAARMLAALPSRWPVRGPVNSEFGMRVSPWSKAPEFHGGIDIRAERGSSVQAPAGGTVTHAGPHAEYGITVILDHGNDIRSVYGHLSKVTVHSGQRVDRGTELGFTGNTGRSSGPHLHYEILVRGQPVNPRGYIWD
jgi:murein DD-endopeptidase MepM/ murein hydrolase activator NlpD